MISSFSVYSLKIPACKRNICLPLLVLVEVAAVLLYVYIDRSSRRKVTLVMLPILGTIFFHKQEKVLVILVVNTFGIYDVLSSS